MEITLTGFDELIKALEGAEEAFMPIASQTMAIALTAVYEQIAPYPPQPDRKRSGHLNRYVRGQGLYPRSAFVADSSEPGGYRTKKVKKTAIKLTSEQMDKSWRLLVTNDGSEIVGRLFNMASYSGWVSGPKEGDPHQVPWHTETGWPNADDSVEAAMPMIEEAMNTAIDQFIERLAA